MKPILVFLSRIATRKVGITEAALLVACMSGATNADLEMITGLPKQSIWSGTNALRKKGLIAFNVTNSGKKIHTLTPKGRELLGWCMEG